MKIKLSLSLIVCSLLWISCGSGTSNSAEADAKAKAPKGEYKNAVALESVPRDIMENLFQNCTLVDYIFHTMPFSMSQDEKRSIQANLSYISTTPAPYIPKNMKPIARMFYQISGDILLEADIYFSDENPFFVFVEDNKPKYANYMTPEGVEFLNRMLNQARAAQKSPQAQGQ